MVRCVGSMCDDLQLCIKSCLNTEWARCYITTFRKIFSHIPQQFLQNTLNGVLSQEPTSYDLSRFLPPPPTTYRAIAPIPLEDYQEQEVPLLASCLAERGQICRRICAQAREEEVSSSCLSEHTESIDSSAAARPPKERVQQGMAREQDCLRMCQANVLSSCPVDESLPRLLSAWAERRGAENSTGAFSSADLTLLHYKSGIKGLGRGGRPLRNKKGERKYQSVYSNQPNSILLSSSPSAHTEQNALCKLQRWRLNPTDASLLTMEGNPCMF